MTTYLGKGAISGLKKVYPRLGLQGSDIILASYPKSGNTWIRFIWANIVSLLELNGRTVDYDFLNGEFAAEYDIHNYGSFRYNSLPRLVKTHMPYSRRRFGKNRSLYIIRNPGDVMVSFYEYRLHHRHLKQMTGDFKSFIREPNHGLEAWCSHVAQWLDQATCVLTYEHLKREPFAMMKDTLAQLEITDILDDVLDEAINRADFSSVRQIEEHQGLDHLSRSELEDGFRFARRGEIDQWLEYFDDEDLDYLLELLDQNGLRSRLRQWYKCYQDCIRIGEFGAASQ
ncbi:MAG: sulfotransferase domain-containing protein [Salinibacter sp.]